MDEATTTKQPKYITWPIDKVTSDDALIFRQMWAKVRRNPHLCSFRRDLAHDYAIAKCSGK